jgi:hypothetical protein
MSHSITKKFIEEISYTEIDQTPGTINKKNADILTILLSQYVFRMKMSEITIAVFIKGKINLLQKFHIPHLVILITL